MKVVTDNIHTIGIVGAGKVGTVLARLALAAGYEVLISGSGDPARKALIIELLAPGATVLTTAEVVERADAVILALPLRNVVDLPPLSGKLVIDAMNYWEPIDGSLPEYQLDPRGTSEIVASHFPGARFTKSFSHLGYHDLDERGRPAGSADRVAIAVAGDDALDVAATAAIVDALGFDPYVAGPLVTGRAFQAHTTAFGYPHSLASLRDAITADLEKQRAS